MKITAKQIKERIAAPTTPFWESVERKCIRLSVILGVISTALFSISATADSVAKYVVIPHMDLISKIAAYCTVTAAVFFAAGTVFAKLTVADASELKHDDGKQV